MALWHFREQKCEIVVLETGLGGLLDATNIITNTKLAVFVSISLDHMAVLGKTLKEIAAQKAGIMKPGAVALAIKGEEEVMEVLKERQTLCRSLSFWQIPARPVREKAAWKSRVSLTGNSGI